MSSVVKVFHILETIDYFAGAKRMELARGVGYLIEAIRKKWAFDTRYDPPGHCCPTCFEPYRLQHSDTCRHAYDSWTMGEPQIDQMCSICGSEPAEEHDLNCWKAILHQLEGSK
jgi:hypothetical protein